MARKRKTKKRRPAKRTKAAVLAARKANRSVYRALAEAVEAKEAEQKSSPPEKSTVDSDQLAVTRCPEGGGAIERAAWAPADVDLQKVPAPVRQAMTDVIEPAYRKMVVEAEEPMERSIGLTMVHLMWLEVLDQHEAKYEYLQTSVLNVPEDRSDMIDRHLRVLNTKVKVASCLNRLRETRQRLEAAEKSSLVSDGNWKLGAGSLGRDYADEDVPVIPDTRPLGERRRLEKRKLGARGKLSVDRDQLSVTR